MKFVRGQEWRLSELFCAVLQDECPFRFRLTFCVFMAAQCNVGQAFIFLPCDFFLWPPWVADADITFLSCFFRLFLSSPNLSRRRLDVYHTIWCGISANLECRCEMCSRRLAENPGRKTKPKNRHWGPSHKFSGYIFATKPYIDNRKKTYLTAIAPPHVLIIWWTSAH